MNYKHNYFSELKKYMNINHFNVYRYGRQKWKKDFIIWKMVFQKKIWKMDA